MCFVDSAENSALISSYSIQCQQRVQLRKGSWYLKCSELKHFILGSMAVSSHARAKKMISDMQAGVQLLHGDNLKYFDLEQPVCRKDGSQLSDLDVVASFHSPVSIDTLFPPSARIVSDFGDISVRSVENKTTSPCVEFTNAKEI